MLKKMRLLRLVAYYCFARYLPASDSRLCKWIRPVRRCITKGLFKHSGKNINIEKGAYFGDGSQIEIGDNSGIGVNCRVYGPVSIGNNVMIGAGAKIIG